MKKVHLDKFYVNKTRFRNKKQLRLLMMIVSVSDFWEKILH